MSREWKPGEVGMIDTRGDDALVTRRGDGYWIAVRSGMVLNPYLEPRPLVVIDPEDREQVERFSSAYLDVAARMDPSHDRSWFDDKTAADQAQAALREFANPKPPKEPTDPTARVTDRRDNIWRLLADGDWVCTSGPDIGEYITWDRLASERGPLGVSDR